MCITPSFVWVERGPNWEKQPVACRQCWQCRANRVSDYVGRSLCEASVSTRTCALTLTYAPRSDLADKVLTPSHFQKFIRSLRRRGQSVRYLVAGEYGSLKGRAHFHAILFFSGENLPEIPEQKNHHMPEWPHGHVFCDWGAEEKSLRYVCKYLLKAEAGNRWFSLSKRPSLGAAFFDKKARELASLGVWPRSFEYLPPGGDTGRAYLLTGATRRDYILALVRYHGCNPPLETLAEWVAEGSQKALREQYIKNLPHIPDDEFYSAFADKIHEPQAKLAREREMKAIDNALQRNQALAEYLQGLG